MSLVRTLGAAFAILCAGLNLGCGSTPGVLPARATEQYARNAQEILPADLDVVVWLDVERLRSSWSAKPEQQVAKILAEYGVLLATSDAEANFWLRLIARAERFWIGCRPVMQGCGDVVLVARGKYGGMEPSQLLGDLSPAVDLGAGWFRYDRRARIQRRQMARIYLAPPDRVVVVGSAELDAVERTLEQGHRDDTLTLEERGLASIAIRAKVLARLLERRAPAAARLLRTAHSIRIVLDAASRSMAITLTIAFSERDVAERARDALVLVLPKLGIGDGRNIDAPTIELIGNELVVRVQLRASSENTVPDFGEPKNQTHEPAAQ